MKKTLFYVTVLTLAVFCSCERYLDVRPTNVVTLSTYDDVKALMGSYIRSFTTTGDNLAGVPIPYRNHQHHLLFGFYADELDTSLFLDNGMAQNETLLHRESLDWMNRNFAGTIWQDYFSAIGFLNTIVDALDDVDGDDAGKDIVRCEARVLRAWYLFKLQQYYSPYGRADLGIPFNLDSRAVGEYVGARRTQAEVYATILTELRAALECPTPPRATYNIFYDKSIVNALLAQVYLFKGGSGAGERDDYRNAITHAEAAMGGRAIMPLNDYEPFTTFPANTFGVFKDKPQALLTSITYSSENGMYAGMNAMYGYFQFAREEALALYPEDDVRRGKFFMEIPEPAVIKYDNVTDGGMGALQVLIFNFFPIADLHLIVAESHARLNETPKATEWLESFRKQRIVVENQEDYIPFTGDNDEVLAEIMAERRREFFMEFDYRWIDMIRDDVEAWGRSVDGAEYSIAKDDFRYCMPLPLLQETAHSKVGQNPGWGL